ncbi:MAG: hypothetical protein OJF49_001206 [Ktedonobacterales bacterium]|jgi:hypothetical protein|nr:MAG: hypothetical protein OJF49_001206 [Ktedonobacterales bacterium]
MNLEDRLDTLLDLSLSSRTNAQAALMARAEEDAEMAVALAAADHLLRLRSATPAATFARTLESRLLAHAATLALEAEESSEAAPFAIRVNTSLATPKNRLHVLRKTKLLWPLIAAVLTLVVGLGTLTVAAAAGPGSPLYALHRWEQGVRAQLAPTAADRVSLHLENARAALAALDSAVARRQGDAVYRDALATLREEDRAAASTLATMPPGAERDGLAAQLTALHAQELPDLFAALPVIGWQDQLTTTQALGDLGAAIPLVTSVTLQQLPSNGPHGWQVTITGSGFAPAAQLVVNGSALGQVIASGPTQLVVEISDTERGLLERNAGVRNPDGTVTALTPLRELGQGGVPPQVTPGQGGSHSGNGNGNGGTHGGGHEPTPSPSTPSGR